MTESALRNKEFVVPIVVALIGLVGTIAGLWVGYRRWLADKRVAASKGFYAGRQNGYQQLWERSKDSMWMLGSRRAHGGLLQTDRGNQRLHVEVEPVHR